MVSNVITIDGPSGVGKGTLARCLATKLKYNLLDSGAIYRLAALFLMQHNISESDHQGVLATLQHLDIRLVSDQDRTRAYLSSQEVSDTIRNEEVGMFASKIAQIADVRKLLLQKQRAFAHGLGLVADGRDMGTIVFPDAQLKFFLDADSEIRAKRRYDELIAKGQDPDYEELLAQLKQRDFQDRNRKTAPLKPAKDAIVIDTTHLSIEEVFNQVWRVILQHQD